MVTTTPAPMLMCGKVTQQKIKIATPLFRNIYLKYLDLQNEMWYIINIKSDIYRIEREELL